MSVFVIQGFRSWPPESLGHHQLWHLKHYGLVVGPVVGRKDQGIWLSFVGLVGYMVAPPFF